MFIVCIKQIFVNNLQLSFDKCKNSCVRLRFFISKNYLSHFYRLFIRNQSLDLGTEISKTIIIMKYLQEGTLFNYRTQNYSSRFYRFSSPKLVLKSKLNKKTSSVQAQELAHLQNQRIRDPLKRQSVISYDSFQRSTPTFLKRSKAQALLQSPFFAPEHLKQHRNEVNFISLYISQGPHT